MLENLFRHLPNVQKVHYTHGPSEMGADFIVEKHDPTINRSIFVGAVVKRGSITQSNLEDVSRQVRECGVRRTINGGKQEIYISEVWVVATGRISKNAQEKVRHEHQSTNVQFISQDDVVNLLDLHYPAAWEDVSQAVGLYLSGVRRRVERLDGLGSVVAGLSTNFYIDLDVIRRSESGYSTSRKRPQKIRRTNLLKEVLRSDFLILQGPMGSGKSKTLRNLCKELCDSRAYNEHKLLPIFHQFKEFIDLYSADVDSLIKSDEKLIRLLEKDDDLQIVVILDGFDEIQEDMDTAIQYLTALQAYAHAESRVRVLISSRPLSGMGISSHELSEECFLSLQPLTLSKIRKFIEAVCVEHSLPARLLEDLKRSSLFRQLPQNPIAALLLSQLLRENSEELPQNMTELYSKSLELMLGRWDEGKGLSTNIEYQYSERVLGEIARHLMDFNRSEIRVAEAEQIIDDYFSVRNIPRVTKENLFDYILERSSVLVKDKQHDTVMFSHRSFAEFLYAKVHPGGAVSQVVENGFDLYWGNTLFFSVGIRRDCPDIIRQLVASKEQGTRQTFEKIRQMPGLLLAAASSPYQVVEDCIVDCVLKTARLYRDYEEGRTETEQSAPLMLILWAFTYLFRELYSYEFFEKAFQTVALRVSDSGASLPERTTALFFLGVVAKELGDDQPFEFLLEEYESELPETIRQAVYCEQRLSQNIGGEYLKRFTRRLVRHRRSDRSYDASIRRLFEAPAQDVTSGKK